MIDGVIFDKDGTLFDFRHSWGAWTRHVVDELSVDALHGARLAEALGFDPATGAFEPDSPVVAATSTEIAAVLLPHLPGQSVTGLAARLDRLSVAATMRPAVPLGPLLGGLRARGLRIGLATNDIEAAARAHLGAEGIADLFDTVSGADSGHGAKPEPGMLLAFAQAMRLAPARILMVGDSAHDLLAGRAAGMRCVGVLTGVATRADLAPLAETVLPDVGHLPTLVDRLRDDAGAGRA